MKKGYIRTVASALVVVGTLALLQRHLVPKNVDSNVEGAIVADYNKEVKHHEHHYVTDRHDN